jgi:hypothetical protein
MDARRLHPPDRPNGARELALKGPQMIDVLDEARGREGVALVEDLVADAAPGWEALAGELHPDLCDVRFRHQNRLAFVAGLVANAPSLEIAHDRARIAALEVREQDSHGRLRHAHDHECEKADERQRNRAHSGQPCRTKSCQELYDAAHCRT